MNFDGTAEKGIELYESALGAKLERIVRVGDSGQPNVKPEEKDLVMHAELRVGGDVLMLCDALRGEKVEIGSNTHLLLDFDDLGEMTQKFEALAAGGKVTMAITDTPWGAKFGMLDDAFGVRWMFNHRLEER